MRSCSGGGAVEVNAAVDVAGTEAQSCSHSHRESEIWKSRQRLSPKIVACWISNPPVFQYTFILCAAFGRKKKGDEA